MKPSARLLVISSCAFLMSTYLCFSEESYPENPKTFVEMRWGTKIAVRDGAQLNATIYVCSDIESRNAIKAPAIVMLTPYVSDSYHAVAVYFARRGYSFAVVDSRGRGNSEGKFDPFVNDAEDAYDVIEWIAKQDWCDSKVTMWGGSYSGVNQWLAAKELPPHLLTIAPVASTRVGINGHIYRAVPVPYLIQWLTLVSGTTAQENIWKDDNFWTQTFYSAYKNLVPFRKLDTFSGIPSEIFQRWVDYQPTDAFWTSVSPTSEQISKITIPILSITGQYDADQLGTLTLYQEHIRYGARTADDQDYLVIGPWDHAGTRNPTSEVGGVKFGPDSMLNVKDLHLRWWDWKLKGGARPEFLKDHVAYYVVGPGNDGKGGWKYASTLRSLGSDRRAFYFSSRTGASRLFESGKLNEERSSGGTETYTYDPLDCHRGNEVENIPANESTSNIDQRLASSLDGDGLIYHSQPFTEEMELAGFPKASLWLEMDVPDTDVCLNLYEVLADGTAIWMWSDTVRARYRESEQTAKLMMLGQISLFKFEPGWFVARKLAKGSRLRLIIAAPNSIYWQKNYNSGGVVADETKENARTAHVVLHHDPDHQSTLDLPLVSSRQ
jgi:uncharacterized protein